MRTPKAMQSSKINTIPHREPVRDLLARHGSFTVYVIFECFGDENYVFRCHGRGFRECFEQFEKATIFDGMTIYDAESEIEVLFG